MTEGTPSSSTPPVPRYSDWTAAPTGGPLELSGAPPAPAGGTPVVWRPRPVTALGRLAAVFIALVALSDIAYAWSRRNTAETLRDYAAGVPGVGFADLEAADAADLVAKISFYVALVMAAIAFLVWLWRARVNSEGLSPAPQRRSRGWVIASWFVPVVNLWFPYQEVSDAWKTSDPETREVPGAAIRGVHVLGWWWTCCLLSVIAARYSVGVLRRDEPPIEAFQQSATAATVAAVASAIAALLLIIIVRRISRWQTQAIAQSSPGASEVSRNTEVHVMRS